MAQDNSVVIEDGQDENSGLLNTLKDKVTDVYQGGKNIFNEVKKKVTDNFDTVVDEWKTDGPDYQLSDSKIDLLIKEGTNQSTTERVIDYASNFWDGVVWKGVDNLMGLTDREFFHDKQSAKDAATIIETFSTNNPDETDPMYEANIKQLARDLRSKMKDGYQLTEKEIFDKIHMYQKAKQDIDSENWYTQVQQINQDKVLEDLKVDFSGGQFQGNAKYFNQFKDKAFEELNSIQDLIIDLKVQAVKTGRDANSVQQDINNLNELYKIKLGAYRKGMEDIYRNKTALETDKDGILGVYKTTFGGLSNEDLDLLINYERRLTQTINIKNNIASLKEGNLGEKILGGLGLAFTGVDNILNIKEIGGGVLGRNYNIEDRDSLLNALASDENFVSLANKSGVAYVLNSSIKNIDDIGQGIFGAAKFNKLLGINKVVNFLDKVNKGGIVGRGLATGAKGMIEGYAYNQGLSLSANELATDDYVIANGIMDPFMENIMNMAGKGLSMGTRYTSLSNIRDFRGKYLEGLEELKRATQDEAEIKKINNEIKHFNRMDNSELGALISNGKELLRNSVDDSLRKNILKDKNSFYDYVMKVGQEYKSTGGVSYKGDGFMISDIQQGLNRKRSYTAITDDFKKTLNNQNPTNLDKYNISRMKSLVDNSAKQLSYIKDVGVRNDAIAKLNNIKSNVDDIYTTINKGGKVDLNNYPNLNKGLDDFKISLNNIKDKDGVMKITLYDIADDTYKTLDVDLDNNVIKYEANKDANSYSFYKLKMTGTGRQEVKNYINAIYKTNNTTDLVNLASKLEDDLGLYKGDITTSLDHKSDDYKNASFQLYDDKGFIRLGLAGKTNREGADVNALLSAQEEATRNDLIAGVLSGFKYEGFNTFTQISRAMKPIVSEILGNDLSTDNYYRLLNLSYNNNVFRNAIESIQDNREKMNAMRSFITTGAIKFKELNDVVGDDGLSLNLVNKILDLPDLDYGINKSELIARIFVGDMNDSLSISLLGVGHAKSNFDELVKNLGGDISVINKLVGKPIGITEATRITDILKRNKMTNASPELFLRSNKNLSRYILHQFYKDETFNKLTGRRTLYGQANDAKANMNSINLKILGELKDTINIETFKTIDKARRELNKLIKNASEGEYKDNLKQKLEYLNTYTQQDQFVNSSLDKFISRIRQASNANDISTIEKEAMAFVDQNKGDITHEDTMMKVYEVGNEVFSRQSELNLEAYDFSLSELKKELYDFESVSKTLTEENKYRGFLDEEGKLKDIYSTPQIHIIKDLFSYEGNNIFNFGKNVKDNIYNEIKKVEGEDGSGGFGTDIEDIRLNSDNEFDFISKIVDTNLGRELTNSFSLNVINEPTLINYNNLLSYKGTLHETMEMIDKTSFVMKKQLIYKLGNGQRDIGWERYNKEFKDDFNSYIALVKAQVLARRGLDPAIGMSDSKQIMNNIIGIVDNVIQNKDSLLFQLGESITSLSSQYIGQNKSFFNFINSKLNGDKSLFELEKKINSLVIPENSIVGVIKKELNSDSLLGMFQLPKDKKGLLDVLDKIGEEKFIKLFNTLGISDAQSYINSIKNNTDEIPDFLYSFFSGVENQIIRNAEEQIMDFFSTFQNGIFVKGMEIENFDFDGLLKNNEELSKQFDKVQENIINKITNEYPVIIDIYEAFQNLKQKKLMSGDPIIDKKIMEDNKKKTFFESISSTIKDLQNKFILEENDIGISTDNTVEQNKLFRSKLFGIINKSVLDEYGADKQVKDSFDTYEVEINDKMNNALSSRMSGTLYDSVSIGATGIKETKELVDVGQGYNRLMRMNNIVSLMDAGTSLAKGGLDSLDSIFKYKSAKMWYIDPTLYSSLRSKFKGWDSYGENASDDKLMRTFVYLNNVNHILKNKKDDKGNSLKNRHISFNPKDGIPSLFEELGVTPTDAQYVYNKLQDSLGDSFGKDFIAFPNIGEDRETGLIVNPSPHIIKVHTDNLGTTLNINDLIQSTNDIIDKTILPDIKKVTGFVEDETGPISNSSFLKRIKQNLTSGQGVLPKSVEVHELLSDITNYNSLLSKAAGTKIYNNEGLTQEELDWVKSLNNGSLILDIGEVKAPPRISNNDLLKEINASLKEIEAKNTSVNRKKYAKQIDSLISLLNQAKEIISEDSFIGKQEIVNELYNSALNISKELPSFAVDDLVTSLNKIKSSFDDIIINRTEIEKFVAGDKLDLNDLIYTEKSLGFDREARKKLRKKQIKETGKTDIDVDKEWNKLVKSKLNSNQLMWRNLIKATYAMNHEKLKDVFGSVQLAGFKDKTFDGNIINFLKSKDVEELKSISDKFDSLLSHDRNDGMGYMSKSLAIKIFENNTGLDYNNSRHIHDLKAHISTPGGLTKTRQMIGDDILDKAMQKILNDKFKTKGKTYDWVLSPKGGMKEARGHKFEELETNIKTGDYDEFDIQGIRKINGSNILVAASHSIVYKDTMKLSQQTILGFNGQNVSLSNDVFIDMSNEVLDRGADFDANRVIQSKDDRIFDNNMLNSFITGLQQEALSLLEGANISGGDFTLGAAGTFVDKNGKQLPTKIDTIYMSPDFFEENKDRFFKRTNSQGNIEYYAVSLRNPVATKYNRGINKVKVDYKLEGRNLTANPYDILLKKEGDYDGDKLSLIFADDKGLKKQLAQIAFIDTMAETNTGFVQRVYDGQDRETYLKEELDRALDSIGTVDRLVNYYVPTNQIDDLPDNLKGDPSKFSGNFLMQAINTTVAKQNVGFVSVAEMAVGHILSDISKAGKSGLGNRYRDIKYGTFTMGELSDMISGMSDEGYKTFANVLQMTLDFAKSKDTFPSKEKWFGEIVNAIKFKDNLSEEQVSFYKEMLLKNIETLGKHIQDFKQHNVKSFLELKPDDFSTLPPGLRDKYTQIQDRMLRLQRYVISPQDMRDLYKTYYYRKISQMFAIKETDATRNLEAEEKTMSILDKFYNSYDIITQEDKIEVMNTLGIKEAPMLYNIDNLLKTEENPMGLGTYKIKLKGDGKHPDADNYLALTQVLLKDKKAGYFSLNIPNKLEMYLEGDELVIIKKYDYSFYDLLRAYEDGLSLKQDKDNVAYGVTLNLLGLNDLSKALGDEGIQALQIFSIMNYGSKLSQEKFKKFLGGLGIKDELQTKLINIVNKDNNRGYLDFLKELTGDDTIEQSLEKFRLDLKDTGKGTELTVFDKDEALESIITKVQSFEALSREEVRIFNQAEPDITNKELLNLKFNQNGDIVLDRVERGVTPEPQYHSTNLYDLDELEYQKMMLRNLEGIDIEKFADTLKGFEEIYLSSLDVFSLSVFNMLRRYSPKLSERIMNIRTHAKQLESLINPFSKLREKYQDMYAGQEWSGAIKQIENEIFKKSKNAPVSRNTNINFPLFKDGDIDAKNNQLQAYKDELVDLLGDDLHKVLSQRYSNYNMNNLPAQNFNRSYLFDLLEDSRGGHMGAINELGLTADNIRDYLIKESTALGRTISDGEIKYITNGLFDLGNKKYQFLRKAKSFFYFVKYGWISMGVGLVTSLVQLVPDYLKVLSMKSRSINDPHLMRLMNERQILKSEILDPNTMIYDNMDDSFINTPIHRLNESLRGLIPNQTFAKTSKMVELLMTNNLAINEVLLGGIRTKTAVAGALDTFVKNAGYKNNDEFWQTYYQMSKANQDRFVNMLHNLAHANYLNLSGGASTSRLGQDHVFSRGWHNMWNFLSGWSTFMTNVHVEGFSNLKQTGVKLLRGDTKGAKVNFYNFQEYVGGQLNNTLIAAAILTKYNTMFNDNERKDGEYDVMTYVKDLNNTITGLQTFIITSVIEGTRDKWNENGTVMDNAMIMMKEILSKFGREFNLPKELIGFVNKGVQDGASSEQIMNGAIDLVRNYSEGYLRYNKFQESDSYYNDMYSTNMFAIMMGVNDKNSIDDLYERLNKESMGKVMSELSPIKQMASVLTGSSYVKMLGNFWDPESFQWEQMKWNAFKDIREKDDILRKTILEGVNEDVLKSILLNKDGSLDKASTSELFKKLTSYSGSGMGEFLDSDGFKTAYQVKYGGGAYSPSQQLVVNKLEDKYGKELVDAVINNDIPVISKYIETKMGKELWNTLRDIDGKDSDKARRDLLLAFDKTEIAIPTMISVLMYNEASDLQYQFKVPEAEAQALAIQKYAKLIDGDVNAINDVANKYMTKQYPNIVNMIYENVNGSKVLSQGMENKLLMDTLAARAYYDGDTDSGILTTRWSGLFNNVYNAMKNKEGGITEADSKKLIMDYLYADEKLTELNGRINPSDIFKYREAIFGSMLAKPEVMKELAGTLDSLGMSDQFDTVRDSLIRRIFNFKNDVHLLEMGKFEEQVKDRYNRTIGISSGGSGSYYGRGFTKSGSNPYKNRNSGNNFAPAQQLLPRAIEKGLDFSKMPRPLFTGSNMYDGMGGVGGPKNFYNDMKNVNRMMSNKIYEQISKDLIKRSPDFNNRIYTIKKLGVEKIYPQSSLVMKLGQNLKPNTNRLSKGLLSGLSYNKE